MSPRSQPDSDPLSANGFEVLRRPDRLKALAVIAVPKELTCSARSWLESERER